MTFDLIAGTALNATIYSATRVSYALGRDRMLPHIFSRLSKRRITPHVALLFSAGLVISVAVLLPTIDVASSASMMFLFLFFLVNLCVIRIRHYMGDELSYGFMMLLFPWLPIAAIFIQALLAVWLIHVSLVAWIVGPAWVVSGIAIYYGYSRHRTRATREEMVTLREEPIPRKKGYRILLAVSNPQNAVQLAWCCYRLGQAKKAEVEVIYMMPVPPQVPLSDASKYALTGEEAIVEAMLYLSTDFTFGSTIRYCRSIARGIISTAAEQRTDLLITGWRGHPRKGFALGSTVDPILERATCNVAVLKNCHQQKYMRVLVPFAGGPNSVFALEVASILVEREGGRVAVFHVSSPGEPAQDIEACLEKTVPSLGVKSSLFEPKYATSSDILRSLLEEAEHYELVVIGATRERLFRRVVMGALPQEFARRCEKPLAMVKASHPVKSFVKRWM